jgi:hypothetical protein
MRSTLRQIGKQNLTMLSTLRVMETECPRCAAVVTVTIEPVAPYFSLDRDRSWCGLNVMHEEEVRDMYGELICVVHICEGGGGAGDPHASLTHPRLARSQAERAAGSAGSNRRRKPDQEKLSHPVVMLSVWRINHSRSIAATA